MTQKDDLLKKIDWLFLNIGGGLVLIISILMVTGVILRYIFRTSIGELQIAIRFSIAWIVFLGGASALIRNKHLSLDLFRQRKNSAFLDKCLYFIKLGIHFFVFIVLIKVSYQSYIDSLKRLEPINRSISQGYFYLPFFAGILLLLLIEVLRIKYKKNNTDKDQK